MSKLPSFEYNGMIFHNVKDNIFQIDRFGDKLIYKFENGKYHLVKYVIMIIGGSRFYPCT